MALTAKEYLSQKGRKWQQFNLHWNFWSPFEMFIYSPSFVFVISLLPYASMLTELVNSQGLEVIPSLFSLLLCILLPVCQCHQAFSFSEQFTWCLDACIREKFVDNKRARELQGFLDGVKKGQEQVLG